MENDYFKELEEFYKMHSPVGYTMLDILDTVYVDQQIISECTNKNNNEEMTLDDYLANMYIPPMEAHDVEDIPEPTDYPLKQTHLYNTKAPKNPIPWPDPTDEMLEDPMFNRIWEKIKTWDICVPEVDGDNMYSGATGNHVRAIMDAVTQLSIDRKDDFNNGYGKISTKEEDNDQQKLL